MSEGIRSMTVSERLHMRLMSSPNPGGDGYTEYPNWQLRMEIEDAKALESELALLRRAVRQLGIERPSLAALFVALDSETNLDVLSDDARVAFRRAMDTAEPDSDVLEFIKGPEPK